MQNTPSIRAIYSKIQSQLFYMIPEKWDSIYLYASIIEQVNQLKTGEMFFYYYPKGILKKNPVNVYEVPAKFNIKEEAYLRLADELYHTIKELRKEFAQMGERLWTNLTISIVEAKFTVEYHYEDLIGSPYSSYDRHVIWKCNYLAFPIERLTKRDRNMVLAYQREKAILEDEVEVYTDSMYHKKVHNIIEYDKEEETHPEEGKEEKQKEKRVDRYEVYKQKKVSYGQYEVKNKRRVWGPAVSKEEAYQAYIEKRKEAVKKQEKKKEATLKKEIQEETRNQILKF